MSFEPNVKQSTSASFEPGVKPSTSTSFEPGVRQSRPTSFEPGVKQSRPTSFEPNVKPSTSTSFEPDVKPSTSTSFEPDVKPSTSFEPDVKPIVSASFEPGVKQSRPTSCEPDVKPSVPFEPDVKPITSFEPDGKPSMSFELDVKPENINTVVLVSASNMWIQPFLFQCAVHCANQGSRVLYISAIPFNKLPTEPHGAKGASSEALSRITFMYLPLRENLLKQMYALHSYAHMPKVIVVEGMEQYCQVTQKEKEKEENPVELYGAMVCASLIDAIGVCAKSCNSSAQLIVSLVHNPDQWASYKTLIDLFFHDVVWFVSNVQEAGVVEEEKIVANQVTSAVEKRKSRVEFVPIASEGTLVLKAIMRMFDTQK